MKNDVITGQPSGTKGLGNLKLQVGTKRLIASRWLPSQVDFLMPRDEGHIPTHDRELWHSALLPAHP